MPFPFPAPDFAANGVQILPRDRPTRFQVFGERSSGTNFVKRLIARNSSLQPVDALGWKHGFPAMVAIPRDVAIVCVVRDARAWALSMHAKPWHCPPDMQRLAFSDFLRAEWATVVDRARYFPQADSIGGVGAVLQPDRDPLTGAAFADLFALRRAKLTALASFARRDCTLVFARLETVQAAPEAFVERLHAELGLGTPAAFRPVLKRLGSRFKPAVAQRPATPRTMPAADLDWLRARVDPAQESALGYDYG